MSRQLDRQPQNEIDGLYYHLITAREHESIRGPSHLVAPDADHELAYDYHPDDLADLVRWEQKIYTNIAMWLLLMTVVSAVVVPFAPLFTPVIAMFFALMSTVFYLWSRQTNEDRMEQTLDWYQQYPFMQWMSASGSLTVSAIVYLFAVMVPYSAVPASVQTLLFLVAMNFTIYTPIAIIRTIRQRLLRKKRLSD